MNQLYHTFHSVSLFHCIGDPSETCHPGMYFSSGTQVIEKKIHYLGSRGFHKM